MIALTLHFVVQIIHACTLTSVFTEKRAKKIIAITILNAILDAVTKINVPTSSTAIRVALKTKIVTLHPHQIAAVRAFALMMSCVKATKSMGIIAIKTQNASLDTVIQTKMFAVYMKNRGRRGIL